MESINILNIIYKNNKINKNNKYKNIIKSKFNNNININKFINF
jgi:hypothetical protein